MSPTTAFGHDPTPVTFLRLWLLCLFSLGLLKVLFDLLIFGWIDLRPVALLELLLLPLGQSVVFWLVGARRQRAPESPPV
jgi:hypothetical protein